MSKNFIEFKIDGKKCMSEEGKYIVEAAKDNGVYIPTLCNIEGLKPKGACRLCSVLVNGRPMTACTTPVTSDMEIENNIPQIENIRKSIVEALFVEGNHLCPSCEKSGACELQALAYRYRMLVPRFPFMFPLRDVDASNPKLVKDHNRCILCKRCIRGIRDEDGKSYFAFKKRSHQVEININPEMAGKMTDQLAQESMDICPVGALLKKESGFRTPIGQRKYDRAPIGSEIEKNS